MDRSEQLGDEVQDLAWALLDEQISDAELRRLEQLLIENEEARRTYVHCVQMHADLYRLMSPAKDTGMPLPAMGFPLPLSDVPFADQA